MSSAHDERGAPPMVAGHTLMGSSYVHSNLTTEWVFVVYHLEPQ